MIFWYILSVVNVFTELITGLQSDVLFLFSLPSSRPCEAGGGQSGGYEGKVRTLHMMAGVELEQKNKNTI